jgi:TonB family protein
MRVMLCIGLIFIGSSVAFATNPQTSQEPKRLTVTTAQVVRAAEHTPRIQYPPFAHAHGMKGAGIFRLHVSLQTGRVKSLDIERSTGHSSLDIAATNTLGTWRFKPERLQKIADATAQRRGELIVRVPVIYTM